MSVPVTPKVTGTDVLFEGCRVYVTPSSNRQYPQLSELLRQREAVVSFYLLSDEDYTHIVATPEEYSLLVQTSPKTAKIILPCWVEHSIQLGQIQPEKFYSANPSQYFSGTVISTSGLSSAQRNELFAAVQAFGGRWQVHIDVRCTHLLCNQLDNVFLPLFLNHTYRNRTKLTLLSNMQT